VKTTDDVDHRIFLRLGYAVARAQLLEAAMVKLLEAQQQDTRLPLDERWDEIATWLGLTAGQLRGKLGVPGTVAIDLKHAVDRRNRVAHQAWMLYSLARDRQASADTWAPWLADEAAMLAQVTHGLARLTELVRAIRESGAEVDPAELERVWRETVPEPVAPRPDR
jgi:heme A synthase